MMPVPSARLLYDFAALAVASSALLVVPRRLAGAGRGEPRRGPHGGASIWR